MAERMLSAHLVQYKAVSDAKLTDYVRTVKDNFVVGTKIEKDGYDFLVDLCDSLVGLILKGRKEAVAMSKEACDQERRLQELTAKYNDTKIRLTEASSKLLALEHSPLPEVVAEPRPSYALVAAGPGEVQKVDLNKLVKKPRYFNGEDPLPREWIEEYEDAIEDNKWNDATAVYYFKHFLVKDAATWFKLSVRPLMSPTWTFKDVFKHFESNFLGRAEQDRLRLLLRNTAMGNDERVATFIPKVLRLVLMLTPEMSEIEQVARVSEKLKGVYASSIVDKDPKTIAELRDVCRKVEAAADLRKAANDARQRASRSDVKTEFKNDTRNTNQVVGDKQKPTPPRSCHRCKRTNHLVKDCRARYYPDRTPIPPSGKPTTPAANVVTEEVDTETVEIETATESESEEINVVKICSAPSDALKLPRLWVRVNDVPVNALVDTGASATIISDVLFGEHNWALESKAKPLIGAGKTSLLVKGRSVVKIAIKIEGFTKSKNHIVYVVKNLAEPLLLGADLICSFKMSINLFENKIKFSDVGKLNCVIQDKWVQLPNSEERICIGDNLSIGQRKEISGILLAQSDAFSLNGELGCASTIKHEIELLPTATPVVEPLRRSAVHHEQEINRQVESMLKSGILETSSSPWASAIVLVKKKTGDIRMCIDYRRLNAVTKKNAFPLPNIESCLDRLAGKTYFSSFDFCSGYLQVPMASNAKEFTAFRTAKGHFQYTRMPFGLCNAPATFQRLMNELLLGKDLQVVVYLDDVCLATTSWEEHLSQLRALLKLIQSANLKLKASKCQIGMERILYLGHEVDASGIRQDPKKLSALSQLQSPQDVSGVRRVVGCFSYYRKFVPNFSKLAGPLIDLTKKNTVFRWGAEEESSFQLLKQAFVDSSKLAIFNNSDPVMLKTDASTKGVAGMLLQKQQNEWQLIACCSRRLSPFEANYGPTDLEGLAVVYATQRFRVYLLGRKFQLIVDHCALCVLKQKMPNSPRLRRWAILLSEFDFDVIYTKGTSHVDVDCLSRSPVENEHDYFEGRILYIMMPVDTDDWENAYIDEESQKCLAKAINEEENFHIRDGLVFKADQLFVPASKRHEVLAAAHTEATAGHGGNLVTLARLEGCYWPTMREDVKTFVASCGTCQLRKANKQGPQGLMRSFDASKPLEILSVDTLGPISETLKKNKFIIVAVDAFTRFVEAKALKTVSAAEANEFLLEYFGRYGPPTTLITDKGSQFVNHLVDQTLQAFGVKHRLGLPDHGQSNAFAERAIGTLQEKLSLNCETDAGRLNWDILLPATILSMNTSINASIQLSPYEMLFGRKFNKLGSVLAAKQGRLDTHVQLLKDTLSKYHLLARTRQIESQAKNKENYDEKRKPVEFEVGEEVLVRVSDRRRNKLSDRYDGPYSVTNRQNDVYTLKGPSNKTIARHVASLKKFIALAIMLSLLGVASAQVPSSVVWRRVGGTFVYDRTVSYDVTLLIISPCESLRRAAVKYNATSIHVSTNATSGNNAYKYETLDPHLQMVDKCDEVFNTQWKSAVSKTLRQCAPLHDEAESISLVAKRGIVANVVGGFAGGFVGAAACDLVGIAWDYLNPYSDHNRLNRAEDQLRELTTKFNRQLDAFANSTKAVSDGLNLVSKEMLATRQELSQLVTDIPQFIFTGFKILQYIHDASRYIAAIGDMCQETNRNVNMPALYGLLKHETFKKVNSKRTYFLGLTSPAESLLRFSFTVVAPSADTLVYSVDPFDRWEFDGYSHLELMRYNGEKKLIYNSSANCAKAVDPIPENPVLYEKCNVGGYHDPSLNLWSPVTVVPVAEATAKFQMKTDVKTNYIYCFPGNITVNNVTRPCPNSPVKLGVWVPFEATGSEPYLPEHVKSNFSVSELEFSISYAHATNNSYNTFELYKEIARLNEVVTNARAGNVKNLIDNVQFNSTAIAIAALALIVVVLIIGSALYWCCCRTAQNPSQSISLNLENLPARTPKQQTANQRSPGDEFVPETFARRKSFKLTSPV